MVNRFDFEPVQKAIAEAESQTSAEIVVSVVEQSGVYKHVFWTLWLALILIFIATGTDQFLYETIIPFSWPKQSSLLLCVFVSSLGAYYLSRRSWTKRVFSSTETLDRFSELRAEVEFFERISGATKQKTGVLIFVSLVERRAFVLADKPIMKVLPQGFLDQVLEDLLISISKKNDLVGGLVNSVSVLSSTLEKSFPKSKDDLNEISDIVIYKKQ